MLSTHRPIRYVTFTLTDDKPILPEVIQRMLDKIPFYSDIVEMRIDEDDGPVPTRRVAIFYTTVMPWEAQ